MSKTQIFGFLMIPFVLFLAWVLTDGIASEIREAEAITESENQVKNRLMLIREAQKAHFSKYQNYATTFDSLEIFLTQDTLYEIVTREIIKPRETTDPLYYTRTDSIRLEYDTLGSELAINKVFPKDKYPNFSASNLRYVPGMEQEKKEFTMKTAMISQQGGQWAPVIEVVNKFPRDKTRYDFKKDGTPNPSIRRQYMRFGSLGEVSLAGNWE